MNARFLLDTNALHEPLRPEPSAAFMARFELHQATLAVAAPAWHEALLGLLRMPPGRKRDSVDRYLHDVILPTVEILPYDLEAARWHAAERARLESAGRSVPFADGMIGAVAVRFGLPLVSHNLKDFQHLAGLTLVDWMQQ